MNKKQGMSVRTVVAIGIGTAIFFVLMRYIPIPTGVPDTNINLAYGFLALMGAIFGPVAGGLIAFLGHMFNDLMVDMDRCGRYLWCFIRLNPANTKY